MAQETKKYTLDFEKHGRITFTKIKKKKKVKVTVEFNALKFTQDNLNLILSCIDIDSTYRVSFDVNNEKSSAYLIKKWFGDKASYNQYNELPYEDKFNIIEEICRRIDKENATHLTVSSRGVDNDTFDFSNSEGVETMADYIVKNYPDLLAALRDDQNGEIVYALSRCVLDKKNNDSILSKCRLHLSFAHICQDMHLVMMIIEISLQFMTACYAVFCHIICGNTMII